MKEPITLDTIFLFDLDSTITSREILPYIASIKGIQKELEKMTEETMKGHLPFRESFLARVDLLKDIPLEEAADVIASVPLNEKLVAFIASPTGFNSQHLSLYNTYCDNNASKRIAQQLML